MLMKVKNVITKWKIRRLFGQRLFNLIVSIQLILSINKVCRGQELIDIDSAYYYVGCYTERTDLFKDSLYARTPQTCVNMCEHQSYIYAILSAERCFCSNDTLENERQDEQLCNTRCLANKAQYCGGVGVHSYYSMSPKYGNQIRNVRIINSTEHSLTILWDAYKPPKMYITGAEATLQRDKITNFLIKSQILHSYFVFPFFTQPDFMVQSTESHFEITNLQPATEYNISIEALCDQISCGSVSVIGTTVVGTPSPEPPPPKVLENSATTITIEIPPIRNDNGPVNKVFVIVERIDDSLSQPFETELLGSWQKAQDDGLPYYITAQLDYNRPEGNQTRKFIVGDGKRYGPFVNIALNKDNHYHVSLGILSSLNGVTKALYTRSSHAQDKSGMDDFTYATFDTGTNSIVALVVICCVFGICLILSLITYFYLRYKTHHTLGRRRGNNHEMTMQQSIIDRDNNGYIVEEDELPIVNNFKQQLDNIIGTLPQSKRLPRNALRMNVNDVIAEGRYGEVITGKLIDTSAMGNNIDCELHVIALDDLSKKDQAHFLHDLRKVTSLQKHEHILDFYGVSSSTDWFYIVFENQTLSLKERLLESRVAPGISTIQRISTFSEELILQWIYEIASAMEYLSINCKIIHKQLCSHNIYVTPDSKLKLSIFGPIPYANNQKKIDLIRWLSPESLRYQHYSIKSDIWSFAIVAWECCALGGTPYANITNSKLLLDAIKSGVRPLQPPYIFQDLYQLFLNCWQLEPNERITFEDITYNVRQLMTSPRHALSFNRTYNVADNNELNILPFYMPTLEMQT